MNCLVPSAGTRATVILLYGDHFNASFYLECELIASTASDAQRVANEVSSTVGNMIKEK